MNWFWKMLAWIGCILYIISPIDIITDYLPVIGRIDDLIILITTIWVIKKYLPQYRYTTYQQKTTKENKETDEDDEKDPYTILGVSRKATQDEIKKAYLELAAKYHPDKVNHLGDEFKELAHKKFIKIQEAYQRVSNK